MKKQTVYNLDPNGDFMVTAIDRVSGNRATSRANVYVLSEEELRKLLSDAHDHGEGFYDAEEHDPIEKQQYIDNLLK